MIWRDELGLISSNLIFGIFYEFDKSKDSSMHRHRIINLCFKDSDHIEFVFVIWRFYDISLSHTKIGIEKWINALGINFDIIIIHNI